MYLRQESEYMRAKLKAARRICRGWVKPEELPSNAEIRDEIQVFARIHEGDQRTANLRDMRIEALRVMRLLLSAHPEGLVVSEIQEELEIPNSTLSHHLEKLKTEGLVKVQRESTFLRYTANTEALQELLQFLYAECCTRNKAVKPQDIVQICK